MSSALEHGYIRRVALGLAVSIASCLSPALNMLDMLPIVHAVSLSHAEGHPCLLGLGVVGCVTLAIVSPGEDLERSLRGELRGSLVQEFLS